MPIVKAFKVLNYIELCFGNKNETFFVYPVMGYLMLPEVACTIA